MRGKRSTLRVMWVALIGSSACGRLGFEPLALEGQVTEAPATPRPGSAIAGPDVDSLTVDGGGAQTPPAASLDEEVGGGGSSGNASGGELDAGAVQGAFGGSGGLVADGGAGGFAGTTDAGGVVVGPSPTCSSTGTYLGISSFATDSEGWLLETPSPVVGTMQWIGTEGSTTLGALDVTTSVPNPSKQAYIKRRGAPTDLSGRIATASVLVVSATDLELRVYALGADFLWADSGLVTLSLGTWTCVALDIDAPSFTDAGFDATQIIEVGLEIGGSGDAHIRVDDIGY